MGAFTTPRVVAGVVMALVAAAIASIGPVQAATSQSTVAVTVASASWIDAAGCTTGAPGITVLPTVLAGGTSMTTADCTVRFGSSNDTAALRTYQADDHGSPLWRPADGSLDAGFDGPSGSGNGRFLHPVASAGDNIRRMAVQPDGKVVAFGFCNGAVNDEFCLARYEVDGSLDASFDGPAGTGDGTFFDSPLATHEVGRTVAIQADGKIVGAGECSGAGNDFCVARYNADGTRDTAFDGPSGSGNGGLIDPITVNSDTVGKVVVQADGRIIVGGACNNGANSDFCLARYTTDGSRDLSFDGPSGTANGAFLHPVGSGNDSVAWVGVMADGRIVATGTCSNGANDDFCAARFMPDGSLDASFDGPAGSGNGSWLHPVGAAGDQAFAAALQPDGKLIIAGACVVGATTDFCTTRHAAADGALDASWDGPAGTGNGTFLLPVGTAADGTYEVLVQPDGRVVLAGTCTGPAANADFCAVRFNGSTGALDPSFGTAGIVLQAIAAGADNARAAVLGHDGTVVVGGYCGNGVDNDFCVMRLGSVPVAGYADGAADWDTAGSLDAFGMCLRDALDGASATGGAWTEAPANACALTDGTQWDTVPADAPGARLAATAAPDAQGGATDPTVHLRFGMRARSDQPSGTYLAPIVFEATAPAL